MPKFKVGQLVKLVNPEPGYEAFRHSICFRHEGWPDGEWYYLCNDETRFTPDELEAADPDEKVYVIDYGGEYVFAIAAESGGKAKSIFMRSDWAEDLTYGEIKSCRRYRPVDPDADLAEGRYETYDSAQAFIDALPGEE